MSKQIALRAPLAVVLLLFAAITATAQTDTTKSPIRLGFFAGPVFSAGPMHAILGGTLGNDGPITVATYIDPADTTFTLNTTSVVRLWKHNGWEISTLIGGELYLVERELTFDEKVTYMLASVGMTLHKNLFDGCTAFAAGSLTLPNHDQRQVKVLIGLHFLIGSKPS